MRAVVVTVLVLLAGLLLAGSPARRLRRLLEAGRSPARDIGGAGALTRRADGVIGFIRRASGQASADRAPADPARSVSEMAALLRAGIPAGHIWQHAVEDGAGSGWALVLEAADEASRSGHDVALALRRGARRCHSPHESDAARSLAATWQVAERTGAPTAAVLQRLADGMRSAADDRAARAAAMAGPRATARVLTWLPLGGLGIGQLIGAQPVAVLVGSPWGRVCAAVGAALAVVSALWTRQLVRAAERIT